jgi:hypothetical protein
MMQPDDLFARRDSVPATDQIQFIRYIDGHTEAEVLHTSKGLFEDLHAIDEGSRLRPSVHEARGREGFRVSRNGGSPIAHRFRGDSRL